MLQLVSYRSIRHRVEDNLFRGSLDEGVCQSEAPADPVRLWLCFLPSAPRLSRSPPYAARRTVPCAAGGPGAGWAGSDRAPPVTDASRFLPDARLPRR